MNLCIKDLYLIFLTIIVFYLLYCNVCSKTKEGFDATSDIKTAINQVYNADVEAIRNLSSIATSLLAGGLTIPGKLNLPNNTSFSADADDGTHWLRVQQTNNPGQYKSLAAQDLWCGTGTLTSATINNSGDTNVGGKLSIKGETTLGSKLSIKGETTLGSKLIVGTSKDGVSSTITDSIHDVNSLCIVGQGDGPTRKIHMWDDVYVNGNFYLDGDNSWIMHTPDDGRKTMYLAPVANKTANWGGGFSFDNDGTINCKQIKVGSWLINVDNNNCLIMSGGSHRYAFKNGFKHNVGNF